MESSHLGGENTIHAGGSIKIEELPNKIFSCWIEYIRWFFGLRWYIIVFTIVFGLFIFFQLESAMETRRQKNKSYKEKKEGMQENVEKIKSILRKMDEEDIANKFTTSSKNVSFSEIKESFVSSSPSENNNIKKNGWSDIEEIGTQFYKWWILPWIYVLFRKFIPMKN